MDADEGVRAPLRCLLWACRFETEGRNTGAWVRFGLLGRRI